MPQQTPDQLKAAMTAAALPNTTATSLIGTGNGASPTGAAPSYLDVPANTNYGGYVNSDTNSGKSYIAIPDSLNSSINSSTLAPTTPTDFQQPQYIPPYNVAALSGVDPATTAAATAEGPTESALSQLIKDSMAGNEGLTGKAADQTAAENAQGLPDLQKTNTDLGSKLKALQNEALAIPLQIQQSYAGRGATAGGVAPIQTSQLRNNAISALGVSTLLSANQGQISTAQMFADKAVAEKYGPLEAEQNARLANLDLLSKDPNLSIEQQKRADAQKIVEQGKADAIKNAREDYSTQIAWSVTAQQNGATPAQAQAIQNAPDLKSAAALYGQFSKDPNAAVKAVADLEQTRAQTSYYNAQAAKMYADAKATGASATLDPSQAIAYAQEYASTGKIPTGLPKGTFGTIAQIAKEAPKADGTVVSNSTGVVPSNVTAGESTDFATAKDIVNKINLLSTYYQQLSIPGQATPNPQTIQHFNDVKGEIVDLIGRLRSGAVLNDSEIKTYADKLPGLPSIIEPLGKGNIKIEDFKNSIASKLDTALTARNASMVGYSKVDVGGQKYTVGQTVTNSKGQQGRVNADGSITII